MRQRRVRRARPAEATPPRRRVWWPQLLITAVLAGVYANSLSGPLIFDDRDAIIDNGTIEDLSSTRVLFPPHETSVAGRPVANVSFAVNYAFDGRDVTGYHAVNVAIHVFCALAVFGITRRTRLPQNAALAVALVWGVHPLNTEAVDYLTQRTESLMALFYLCTLYCAIRAADTPPARRTWSGAAIAACALGMATKESMVTAPLAVILYDRVYLFPSLREAMRERGRLYAGLAATWGVLAALMWTGPRNLSAGFGAPDAHLSSYLMNQSVMIVRYLRLAVAPTELTLYYGWPMPVAMATALPRLLAIALIAACTAWALRRRPEVGFLGAWFFLTLAPTSSIVPIATEVGAERRMYLPLIALVVLAVLGARRLLAPRFRAPALAACVALLGAATIARNAEYRSSLRLAETAFERWPTPGSESMLGTELAAAGRLEEAERHLRSAAPRHAPARYYLGTVLAAEGRPSEAVEHFRSFISAQPPELEQVRRAHAQLAAALLASGRQDEAEAEYRLVVAGDPSDAQAMVQLAQLLLRRERYGDAIVVLRRLTAARPTDAWAHGALGIALASTGRVDESIEAFRRQVALDPQNAHARQNLARALEMRR